MLPFLILSLCNKILKSLINQKTELVALENTHVYAFQHKNFRISAFIFFVEMHVIHRSEKNKTSINKPPASQSLIIILRTNLKQKIITLILRTVLDHLI